jgi:predicted metal-dependent peptidase
MGLTPAEKITRAKIKLYQNQPFFSYIVNHMNIAEKDEDWWNKNGSKTMCVDSKGNCFYYAPFVDSLEEYEIQAVISHEAMHIALEHLNRFTNGITNDKDISIETQSKMKIWNIATDLLINNMLINSNISLPKGCIIPTGNNEYKISNKKTITDIDKKTSESIYNELYDSADKIEYKGFDVHIYNSDGNQKGNKPNNISGNADIDWKQVLSEATTFAKQRGKLSGNIERFVDKILNKKLNWKQMLYRYITNELQCDFSYSRPSRRFISTGIYHPSIAKENLDIMVAIDTSGSISQKELGIFLGEIYKITKSHPNISLEVLFHDDGIRGKTRFNHTNLYKISTLKPVGFGGTSHTEVFEYANKKRPSILICFTDGYSDIDECQKYNNTLFILTADYYKNTFGNSVVFDRADMN